MITKWLKKVSWQLVVAAALVAAFMWPLSYIIKDSVLLIAKLLMTLAILVAVGKLIVYIVNKNSKKK